ncbi:Crp/Fnr family transcriptional regulator [Pontibacter sp. MBLB2868]|uniref:Crp/Fnr family transcriptional regulator n=1 Tax=Pontibacter sp. MBLB2868 TaxID=3451555 RepID=UPI003F74C15C
MSLSTGEHEKTKQWYLENFNIFSVLTTEDRQQLGKLALMQKTNKEEVIYFSGDTSNCFYLIKEGRVKITQKFATGKEVILAILGPGEIFGELAVVGQASRTEVAVAAEDSLVCKFNACDFTRLMAKNPRLILQISKTIGERLEKVQRRLESLIFKTAEERIMDFLKELAKEYGHQVANNPNEAAIHMHITHEEIGKLTATSRQTVSSVLKNLEKAGIILYDRHRIYIKSLSSL